MRQGAARRQPERDIERLLAEAWQHHHSGRLDAAEAACGRILARRAKHEGALHLLATLAYHKGDYARAAALGREVLAVRPDDPGFHYFLGNVLRTLKRPEEAMASFREALRLKPDFPQALNNLGNTLRALDRTREAGDCYRRAIALKPDYALAHYNLGNICRDLEQHHRAAASYRRALEITPDYFDALNNLGNTLKDLDRIEEAVALYERALRVNPDSAEALNNLGNVLKDLNRLDEAAALFQRAVTVAPDFGEPHFGYSLVLLTLGDYARGWDEYEWRWQSKEFPSYRWNFSEPAWRGEDLAGRTILLHCEQGYGDNIQLLRYAPMVHAKGGRIILELMKPLVPVARTVKCPMEIITIGAPRPPFDVRCSMMSLPLAFRSTLETLPREVPYIFPDAELKERWRARLGTGPELKVGVVWAGNPRQPAEVKRGIGIDGYRALFTVPGVRWFSLQVGPRAPDLKRLPPGLVADLSPELTDFAQTAAAIANLDLVITTDTSVAHLAGAIGHPAWVMLRWAPDWRWGMHSDTTPWYPTLRLFRQAQRDDWRVPVAAARAALEQVLAERR